MSEPKMIKRSTILWLVLVYGVLTTSAWIHDWQLMRRTTRQDEYVNEYKSLVDAALKEKDINYDISRTALSIMGVQQDVIYLFKAGKVNSLEMKIKQATLDSIYDIVKLKRNTVWK